VDHITIEVGELTFDALAAGPRDGPLVLLLHGFPQTSYAFRHQLAVLGTLGYRAVAPDQRGYSPGARPEGVEPYTIGHLSNDVVAMADALGAKRFHLVGHDWGGAVAWVVASRFPGRLRSLTVLSTPHYGALSAARSRAGSDQAQRSSYFTDFAAPGAEKRLLADGAALLRDIYQGLEDGAIEVYLEALGHPEALRAALAWYGAAFGPSQPSSADDARATQANPSPPSRSPPISVPTLYVWSTEDSAFGREAAEATARFVGPAYRFEVIEGVGHWVAEEAREAVTRLLVDHLADAAHGAAGEGSHVEGIHRRRPQRVTKASR
jgi:pimeloyl-ACP methyl ester carboxylesterase